MRVLEQADQIPRRIPHCRLKPMSARRLWRGLAQMFDDLSPGRCVRCRIGGVVSTVIQWVSREHRI
jgi:hypothetical protein